MFQVPEQHRFAGPKGSNNGAFKFKKDGIQFRVVASDGMGWEHVSDSLDRKRTPDWEEMCYVKSLFWGEEDCVVQYHPPKSEYVSYHEYCLHMWKPTEQQLPMPPSIMVGPKGEKHEPSR